MRADDMRPATEQPLTLRSVTSGENLRETTNTSAKHEMFATLQLLATAVERLATRAVLVRQEEIELLVGAREAH